jgi:gliding motility-associated-like protein
MRKFLLAVSLLTGTLSVTAQDFSNKGKEFWLAYCYHVSMVNSAGGPPQMTLYITSDQATTYNVEAFSAVPTNIASGTLTAGQVVSVSIPNSLFIDNDGKYLNKAIRVTSGTNPIAMYAYITRSAVSGATLCLPTNVLGKDYYAVSFDQFSNETNSNSYITIVAVEDGTTVEITPSVATKGGWAAGSLNVVSLNKGEIYQVLGTTTGNNGGDLTGTRVRSVTGAGGGCKRIAVFSGTGKVRIPQTCAANSSDNLFQQCYPTASWGKKYITIPSFNRTFNYFRICKADPTAVVTVNGNPINPALFVNDFYYQFTSTEVNVIESDKPILVAQYFTTQTCNGNASPYDPEMIFLNPVEQNISDVTLVSSNLVAGQPQHHIHVVSKNGGTALSNFLFDNAPVPVSSWTPVPGDPTYSYIYFNNVAQGYHTLSSDTGFNALAYGYAVAESYGYSAGTNVKDLYNFITPINPFALTNDAVACTGTPFFFSVTYPFQPTSLVWDFHGTHPNVTISNPASINDSTYFIGSRQVWRYKLPNLYSYSPANSNPGYLVSIVAGTTNSEGCGSTFEKDFFLKVFDPTTARIGWQHNGCVTDSVQFRDSSDYQGALFPYKWWWDFGDGSTDSVRNPKHRYAAPGTYTVRFSMLTSAGCFSDTASRQITVTLVPDAKFGVSSPICEGKVMTFSDSSIAYAPASLQRWYWDYGDASSAILTSNSNHDHTYAAWGNKTVTLRVETNSGCQSALFTKVVTVHPNPVASFNMPAGLCLPAANAQFTSTSTIADNTQAGFIYNWDFGDPGSGPANNTATTAAPTHLYSGTGPFTIKLEVRSAAGCVDDSSRILSNVFAQPKALFTVNAENCLNDPTTFTDNSLSNTPGSAINQWFWDFGDGQVSALQNPVHVYAAAGTYTVKLYIRTDRGCNSDTLSKQVVINPLPAAGYATAGPYCVTRNITFTDASVANAGIITIWRWNMGDGTLQTFNNNTPFTHVYAATGTYNTTLQVETDKGCKSTLVSIPVVINPLPVPSFTHTRVCLPDGIANFTNTSTIADGSGALMTYVWDFGDVASGANNNSTLTNPSHQYSAVGPYTATLTATSNNNCIATVSQIIADIYPQAKANFTVNPENCLNDVTNFTDNSNGMGSTVTQWFWDFGDGQTSTLQNPTHTYAAANTYTVRLYVRTDKNCNSDTITKTVVINPLPAASFSNSAPQCATRSITFTDGSVANAGNITTWRWNMGDGTVYTLANNSPFTHTYATTGTFTVTLSVETNKGCKSSVFSRTITVSPLPEAGFILPEVCLSDAFAQFTDTSKIVSGSITNWAWNFGDPASGALNTSALQNPQHKYNAVGNYTVTLIVTSNTGCTDTIAQSFVVNGDIPVANFTPLNPATMCANDSIAIQDASTVNFGSVTKVEIYWDNLGAPTVFETDDFPTPGKIYKHKYPNFQSPLTRNFTIRYRSYSGGTCVNDRIRVITVNAAPAVAFAVVPNICLDATPFQITQATETGGVPGTGVFTGTGVTATGIFNPATAGVGTHTIRYTYTSTTGGCVDFKEQSITVLSPPTADFSVAGPVCATKAISFTDASATPAGTGTLTTWTWNFGDGTPAVIRTNNSPFTHTFANAGTFTVTLRVTTSNGCNSVVKSLPVTVNPLPVVSFAMPKVCLPNASATFTDQSSIADGTQNAFTYAWNFGDPGSGAANTAVAKNPTHIYTAEGPYNVTLVVTSGAGCISQATQVYDDVHPQPIADFTIADPDGVCIGDPISFTDNSDGVDGTLTSWYWDLGDGSIRTTANVLNYTYATAKTYTVKLYVENSQGCKSDTFSKPFTVHPYPTVDAGPDLFVLEGGSVTITPVVTGNDLQFLWTPGSYLDNAASRTPVCRPLDDITYTLRVTARGGCAATDKVFVKLLKSPEIPNTFTPNNDGINDFWEIKYLNTYPQNRVQVFSRTGQLVFESRGYNKAWNGTFNGKALPFDTYYYVIEPGNGRKTITGYVTIVK